MKYLLHFFLLITFVCIIYTTRSFFDLTISTKNQDVHKINLNPQDLDLTTKSSEVSLIYIGSSQCPFCDKRIVSPTLNKLSDSLLHYLNTIHPQVNYNVIGLSIDELPSNGFEHLLELDIDFHEMSTGNSWRNISISEMTNEELQFSLATPQILILKTFYSDTLGSAYNKITNRVLIDRYLGSTEFGKIDHNSIKKRLSEIDQ
jgi:hypothetical protein